MLDGSGEREVSTTMSYVRFLTLLSKDKTIGKHVVQSFLMKREPWDGPSF